MSPFYRIKRQRCKDKVYYYLYKEWYDSELKKRRSKLIGRCDELEKIIEELEKLKQGVENFWCGGWDLNPRRPMPSGSEPDPFDLARAPPHKPIVICYWLIIWRFYVFRIHLSRGSHDAITTI
jgi:hypothetical protein